MGLNKDKESYPVPFREVQKPNQVLTFIVLLIVIWLFNPILSILFLEVPLRRFLLFILYGILFLMSLSIKLITEVRENGVYVCSYPMYNSFRSIPFRSIQSYEVRNLSSIWDYDRRGFHYGFNGDTYNLSANRGVFIEFTAGRSKSRIIIGSQSPEKLVDAIRSGIEKQTFL